VEILMEKHYSKIDKERLLHIINRLDNESERKDIVPAKNFIQCAVLNFNKGKTFRPHKHIRKSRTYPEKIAQESWVVIKGSVKCIFYDIDDSILLETTLHPGDASFTLEGGHTYEILEDNTIVYEYKTGPYEGQEFDKRFLDE
tara:strand:- start:333 stop:761 length:429 start_codon:yes stop_codon:yes gene_type:complete